MYLINTGDADMNANDLSLAEIAYQKAQADKAAKSYARWCIYRELLAAGWHCTDALHESVRRARSN